MKLSVIIPVYNEEQTIDAVIDRVWAVDLGAIEKEIIIADDGSTDATAQIVDANRYIRQGLIQIRHSPINLGKGAAVRLGLAMARGDILLVQDADLELDPAEYGSLLQPILEGRADIVYGSRFLNRSGGIPSKPLRKTAAAQTPALLIPSGSRNPRRDDRLDDWRPT